jgi:hypothetical protein
MRYPQRAEPGIAARGVVLFNGDMSRDVLIAVAIVAADLVLLRVYGRRPRGLFPAGRFHGLLGDRRASHEAERDRQAQEEP